MKSTHLKAPFCRCPEPVGDPREGSCILCGHQVPGYEIPAGKVYSLGVGVDQSTFAQSTRKFRPAA